MEKKQEVYCIYPFCLHLHTDDRKKQALAGLRDNSCLRIRHWARRATGMQKLVQKSSPDHLQGSCVNSLTSECPHKVMEGYELLNL